MADQLRIYHEDLEVRAEQLLDEFGPITVARQSFWRSEILKELDRTAFDEVMNDEAESLMEEGYRVETYPGDWDGGDKLQICQDCADWLESELTGDSELKPEDHQPLEYDLQENPWKFEYPSDVPGSDCPEFVWRPCEGCGSALAGRRYNILRLD